MFMLPMVLIFFAVVSGCLPNNDSYLDYEIGRKLYNTQDYQATFKYFSQANGLREAQFSLGVMYEYGYGVNRDYKKAVEWYRKAAKQGYADAQAALKELGETW